MNKKETDNIQNDKSNQGARSQYKTKQKESLLEYFSENEGKHITASDVCDHFKGMGLPIGQSTVTKKTR